jgi:uncharacterized protein
LRRLAAYRADAPAGLVTLEAYLRGRGLNPLADGLGDAVRRSDAALRGASASRPSALQAAARALGMLKGRVADEVAPALEVSIGFSDADGD